MHELDTERPEIQPVAEDNTEDEDDLSGKHQMMPLISSGFGFIDFLQRAKDIVRLRVDNLATIHDTLSSLHDTTRNRNTVQ